MSNYDNKLETTIERTSASMYAFWSAMLTAHTVLLSVAVALPAATAKADLWQFKLVGTIATLCIFALLFNFAAVRMQYETIGQRLINYETELSEIQRKKDITIAERRRFMMRCAEVIATFGLVIEACLLFWVLVQ